MRVLGGIFFFALLHNPVQALGAIISSGQSITLAWSPSTDPNVVGYNLYYGGASGNYTNMINAGNATSATVPGLIPGDTYYFAATMYSASGAESPLSSQVAFTLPFIPAIQLRFTPTRQFILTVTGPIGHIYEIQATQDFVNWTVIGTVTIGASGSLDFTDVNATSFSKRFYRTQELP